MFYVYEWFNVKTNEIFYVGKGKGNRYQIGVKRNKLFLEYYKNNECDVRIIKYFETENEAFEYERLRIEYLKDKNQCMCNIRHGGYGGITNWWTPDIKNYYSKNNIMKLQNQKERMSKNNPMKNPNTVKKVVAKKSKKIVIGNKIFSSIVEASKEFNVRDTAIQYWLERGYSNDYKICYYYGEEEITVKIKTHICNKKSVIIDDKKFSTVKEGSAYIGVSSSVLIRCIKKNKLCKGHICKYDNQQPSAMNTDKSNGEGSTTNE